MPKIMSEDWNTTFNYRTSYYFINMEHVFFSNTTAGNRTESERVFLPTIPDYKGRSLRKERIDKLNRKESALLEVINEKYEKINDFAHLYREYETNLNYKHFLTHMFMMDPTKCTISQIYAFYRSATQVKFFKDNTFCPYMIDLEHFWHREFISEHSFYLSNTNTYKDVFQICPECNLYVDKRYTSIPIDSWADG